MANQIDPRQLAKLMVHEAILYADERAGLFSRKPEKDRPAEALKKKEEKNPLVAMEDDLEDKFFLLLTTRAAEQVTAD